METLWQAMPRMQGYDQLDTVEMPSIQEQEGHDAVPNAFADHARPSVLARLGKQHGISARARRRLLQVGVVCVSACAGAAVLLLAGFFHTPTHSTASTLRQAGDSAAHQAPSFLPSSGFSSFSLPAHHASSSEAVTAATTSLHALDAEVEDDSLSFVVSNEYPSVTELYPWTIVEPERVTTLTVRTDGAVDTNLYTWEVRLSKTGEIVTPSLNQTSAAAGTLLFVFTEPAAEYTVTVTETSATDATTTRSATSTVRCKYVRREIRQLTDDDRERYFSAMEVVARVDYATGQAKYGSKFTNMQKLAKKHLYGNVCTPYHGGLSFFTAHAAFTLELDQAMQSIDPIVSQPYWDYTIDDSEFGHHWEESVIWDDEWFGALASTNDNHVLEGRFAGVTYHPKDYNFSEHNPYGILTKSTNADPSMLVTRAHQFCDLKVDLTLPGCATLLDCLNTTDLGSLHHCAEDRLHGNIHNVIGGFHGCPVSLGKFGQRNTEYRNLLMNLGEVSEHLWATNTGIEYKATCSEGEPFENCRGRCSNLTKADLMGMSNDELTAQLAEYKLVYFQNKTDLDSFKSPLMRTYFEFNGNESSGFSWRFKPRGNTPANDAEQGELMRVMLDYGCNPGKYGTMSTGAAPNDPIFWPIHPSFDRMWQYVRLAPQFKNFDHTWTDDASCYGHSAKDVLPFSNLFGENETDTEMYSNAKMYSLFNPTNDDLPYVFADFDFSGCGYSSKYT